MSTDTDGLRHGWTYLSCPDCAEVIYDNRRVADLDMVTILAAHRAACPGRHPGRLPLWRRLIERLTP